MPYFDINVFRAGYIIEETDLNTIRSNIRYLRGQDGEFEFVFPAGFINLTSTERDALRTGQGTISSPYIYPPIAAVIYNITLETLEIHSGAGSWGPLGAVFAPGTILDYVIDVVPLGYLKCDGASVMISDYSALFDVIGTNYGGSGDNFNLPDLAAIQVNGIVIIKT